MTVRVENMTAGYSAEPILFDIDITVKEGRICGLIGHNGSGKTTLMRCINAILKPAKGRVFVEGKETHRLGRHRVAQLISVVPQGTYSPFAYSSLEMILMGGASRVRPWASPGADETTKAWNVCAEVGIENLAPIPFNHLSGGQKQLVMLARALYQDSPVMLLDEPNSHLDFCNQHRMMNLVHRVVKERGTTVLVTLHDPNLALHYCDEVVMLKEGRVIAMGPAKAVMTDGHLETTLGENIRIDITRDGTTVVIPKHIPGISATNDGR